MNSIVETQIGKIDLTGSSVIIGEVRFFGVYDEGEISSMYDFVKIIFENK